MKEPAFPPCPVHGSAHLIPIRSWREMHAETLETGVEFDAFWYQRVHVGVAYFFRWLGVPRQTVLAIWDEGILTHIECRMSGDIATPDCDSMEAIKAVQVAFRAAGFVVGRLETSAS